MVLWNLSWAGVEHLVPSIYTFTHSLNHHPWDTYPFDGELFHETIVVI